MIKFNQESVRPKAENPCPELVFDRSIKMPVDDGWAKVDGMEPFDLLWIGVRKEERQRIAMPWGEGWGVGPTEEKANQPCENSGGWPQTTSPIGPAVAEESLGVPSL